jgi:hypothetical protein
VKFSFLLGKTIAKTVTMLKEAFKDEAMGTTRVYEQFSLFKRGEMSVEDPPHCDLPSTGRIKKKKERERVAKVRQAVLAERHLDH